MEHKIIYNDFAPLAAENATVPAEGSSPYQSAGDLLNTDARNLVNYASFESLGINLLNFDLSFAESTDNIGYVSSAVSNNSKIFSPSVDIVIDLANGYYSSPGITLHFWQNYCTEFSVSWYRDDIQLQKGTYYPLFSEIDKNKSILTFYGEQTVENFNKIIISFNKSELPNQFVKLAGIDLGKSFEITKFFGPINVFREISDDCSDLPGSTCEFEAQIFGEFSPQEAQELFLYSNDELQGKFIADCITPNGDGRYSFECSDDVMMLDGSSFPAVAQGTHKLSDILAMIKTASNIDIEGGNFNDSELTGFVEAQKSSRTAAAIVAFSIGCFIVSNSKKLEMRKPRNRKNRIIGANRIIGKAKYKQNAPYTSIILKAFSNDFDTVAKEERYDNPYIKATNSVGEKIYEKFSLIGNFDERFEELKEIGFYCNEITATIVLEDENIGDIITIETPYNGLKTGIIKSMDISYSTARTAEITVIERDYAANGGEG